jgi:hypothetical protein
LAEQGRDAAGEGGDGGGREQVEAGGHTRSLQRMGR